MHLRNNLNVMFNSQNLRRFAVIELITIVVLVCSGCEQPNITADAAIWISLPESRPRSGDNYSITVNWRFRSGASVVPGHYPLRLEIIGPDGISQAIVNGLYIDIDLDDQQHSLQWIWDGRVSTPDRGRRPAPPGDYTLYVSAAEYHFSATAKVYPNDYDQDGDNISDAIENENSGVQITFGTNTYDYVVDNLSRPPVISWYLSSGDWYANRGTHEYSLAKDTRGNGCLYNGLRIADQSTGYRYYPNTDPTDTDNWATLLLINELEQVARVWGATHSDYPMTTLDFSKQNGESFPPHDGHQNGLDADIMYIGSGTYQYGSFIVVNVGSYDATASLELMQLFNNLASVDRIWTSDQALADYYSTDKIQYLSGHTNHFHVDFLDADGSQSCP